MKWRWQNTKTEKEEQLKCEGGKRGSERWIWSKQKLQSRKTKYEWKGVRWSQVYLFQDDIVSVCMCTFAFACIKYMCVHIWFVWIFVAYTIRRTSEERQTTWSTRRMCVCVFVRANKRMEKGKHASKPFLSAECIITFKLFKILLTFKWRKRRNRQE